MNTLKLMKSYYLWLEKQWHQGNLVLKVFLFFLAPQIIAFIVTGLTLGQIWKERHDPKSKFRAHVVKNVLLWGAALLLFWGFWLVIFPFITLKYIAW
jgi:uncharacterized membrane protein